MNRPRGPSGNCRQLFQQGPLGTLNRIPWITSRQIIIFGNCRQFGRACGSCSFLPECFSGHVGSCDAMVHEGLAPHRVQGVLQGLCPQLIGLEETSNGGQCEE